MNRFLKIHDLVLQYFYDFSSILIVSADKKPRKIKMVKKIDQMSFHLCKIIWIYDISKGNRSIISVYLHAISFKLIAYDLLR